MEENLTAQPSHRFRATAPGKCRRFGALLLLLVDHIFRCAGDEVRVAEFGVEARDLGFGALQFFCRRDPFLREVRITSPSGSAATDSSTTNCVPSLLRHRL